MKFKKLLGAVCSFLLATTSFLCGGPASAKNLSGDFVYITMVNSGQDLGNGECDGDERDKKCWNILTGNNEGNKYVNECVNKCVSMGHYKTSFDFSSESNFLNLNLKCPTARKAMKYITDSKIPDVFMVIANLAKNGDEVRADINKHFDQILECNDESVLYGGDVFNPGQIYFGKEVRLNAVSVIMYGFVPEGMEQLTSDEEFVEIAKQIKLERQGNGAEDGKFKYIHNNVFILQSKTMYTRINMDNNVKKRRSYGIRYDVMEIAENKRLQPTLWPNYHDEELPRRKASPEEVKQRIEEEEAKRKAEEAKRKAEEEKKARRKAEADARWQAIKKEGEARRKAEEEARQKAREEAERKAQEEARRKAEAAANWKARKEAFAKWKESEEFTKWIESEKLAKLRAEALAKLREAEAPEEAIRKAEAAAAFAKWQEQEARQKAQAKSEAIYKAQAEARRKAEEEEARRKAQATAACAKWKAEEKARQKAQAAAAFAKWQAEEARRKAQEEEARRKAQAEEGKARFIAQVLEISKEMWQAEGRILTPEVEKILKANIESHFLATLEAQAEAQ